MEVYQNPADVRPRLAEVGINAGIYFDAVVERDEVFGAC